jgi:hypothetical protein
MDSVKPGLVYEDELNIVVLSNRPYKVTAFFLKWRLSSNPNVSNDIKVRALEKLSVKKSALTFLQSNTYTNQCT